MTLSKSFEFNSNVPFAEVALSSMLSSDPAVQATVLGVRKGDPGADRMDNFSPTDGDWPRVIRVNPILAWEYSHVWRFIRALSLPYPSLYDQAVTVLYSINSEQDF